MRFGVGVRFPVPGQLFLVGKAFARSLVGAGSVGKVALSGKASARYAWRSGLGSVPIITTTSFTLGTNPGFDAFVGHIDATNSPTSYAITSGNATGAFTVYASGNLRTSTSVAPPDNVYPLTVTASNSFGSSPPATVAVTVGAVPSISNTSFGISLPAASGALVGTVAVSGGTPTSFAITSGNSAGYFTIDNSGDISVTSTGATGLTAQTYNLTVQVTNGLGSDTASVSVAATAAGGFSDNDWPTLLNRPVKSGTTLTFVGPSGGGANNGSPIQQTVTLAASSGARTISAAGTYTGLNLTDTLTITASNVTIRNSYLSTGGGSHVVAINSAGIQNVIIEDCEIVGGGASSGVTGQNGIFVINNLGIGGVTLRRNNIHHSGNGVSIGDAPYQITDNYIHDLTGAAASHFNGIQDNGHTNHDGRPCLIQHNQINNNLQNQTDAIMLCNLGDNTGVTVNNNKLLGAGITAAGVVYVDGNLGNNALQVIFTNNVVGPNANGNYVFSRVGTASSFSLTHSGNTSATTGNSIDGTF